MFSYRIFSEAVLMDNTHNGFYTTEFIFSMGITWYSNQWWKGIEPKMNTKKETVTNKRKSQQDGI